MPHLPKLPDLDNLPDIVGKFSKAVDGVSRVIDGVSNGIDRLANSFGPDVIDSPAGSTPPASPNPPVPTTISRTPQEEVATSIKRGCLPCSMGHMTTCTGLLNEAMRFARKEGLGSDQVIEDTNACLAELNALERVDLTPEKMSQLPEWEKALAIEALDLSKSTRMAIENAKTPDDLETVAATLQPSQLAIAKKWVRGKLANLPETERQKLAAQVQGQ